VKLWILRPREDLPGDDPWSPGFDKTFGFVVCAELEEDARRLADSEAGGENSRLFAWAPLSHPWLDALYSTCEELLATDEPGIILQDYRRA
jgi:hypothetical protein